MGISERGRDGDIRSHYKAQNELSDKNYCPFFKTCSVQITRDYFNRVCNTNGYLNCHHFSKRLGELKTPIGWLQRIAVEKASMSNERT